VKKTSLILVFLFTGLAAQAQFFKQPVIIEPKIHTGLIIPFYDALGYLVQDDVYAYDLSVGFPTFGRNYWEKLYRYPRAGAGYSCWSLGNDAVFGKAHALYSFLNVPFLKKKRFSLNYQFSFGGAYFPKRFDEKDNHLNRAIGSHGNVYIRVGIDGRIKLLPGTELVVEAGLTHFSNGKIKSPNYGLNAGSFSIGINYLFNSGAATIHEPEIPGPGKRCIQSVIYSAGIKVYDNLLDKKYFATAVTYNLERKINHKKRVGFGADLFYDGSIREALAGEDGKPENDFDKLIRFGLHGSYSVRYKQLIMGIQVGHYLYSKYTVLTPFYNRISVQYLFPKNLIGSIAIKTHLGKADCLEWGIGYYW
jgi:hypothetical protein